MKNAFFFFYKLQKSFISYSIRNITYCEHRNYCNSSRNPYEVLGLPRTCSTKEIKMTYIKLCKELHPDMKPGDRMQHRRFIELNDAYTTLVDPATRQHFDRNSYNLNQSWRNKQGEDNPFRKNGKEYENSYKYEEYRRYQQSQWSYNSSSNKSNPKKTWIVMGCIFVICISSIFYVIVFSLASSYQKKKVDEKSKKLSEEFHAIRQNAKQLTTKERIEKLRKQWKS